jgi:WD40 repeat protein
MWVQKVSGGGVLALAYSPDGRTLYTKDGGGNVSRWDTQTRTGGRTMRPGPRHRFYGGFGLADHGKYVVAVNDTIFVQNTATSEVRTLDAKLLTPYSYPSYVVQADPFAPRLLILHEDGAIKTWDLEAWQDGPALCTLGEPAPIRYPRFDVLPNGRALICAYQTNRVYLFDAAAGSITARYAVDTGQWTYLGHASPDVRTAVFFHGHRAYIWDLSAGRMKCPPIASFLPGTITAFHPTAPVFAALNADRHLTLFSLETGEPIRTMDFALGRQVQCVCFSPDGLTCAIGGSNKQFAVFDVDL